MELRSNFRFIKKLDINQVLNHLPNPSDPVWQRSTHRQDNYEFHKKTRSLLFYFNFKNEVHMDMELLKTPLGVEVMKLVEHVKSFYPTTFISKLMITSLPAGEKVGEHTDGLGLRGIHRIHIPLVTNTNCFYIIEKISYHFPPGFCFEFDNTRLHKVENDGNQERLHIILDLNPEK